MILKSILVEDEQTSREILRNYLSKYCPNIAVVGEAATIDEALVLIRNNDIDLLFLDVEMPYGSGFDLLDKLGTVDFEVIFVTAYNQYAIEALNKHASYYLLKPISIDDLIKAVDYVTELKEKEKALENAVLTPVATGKDQKITIPVQDGFEVLDVKDILYCKADDNYTELFLESGQKKLVSKTLKYFEGILDKHGFARIHKSYLVNVAFISSYKKGKGGTVTLNNGKELSVSASKKATLLSFFK